RTNHLKAGNFSSCKRSIRICKRTENRWSRLIRLVQVLVNWCSGAEERKRAFLSSAKTRRLIARSSVSSILKTTSHVNHDSGKSPREHRRHAEEYSLRERAGDALPADHTGR